MASTGDEIGTISHQPDLVIPEAAIDEETNRQKTPQTVPAPVDSALLELVSRCEVDLWMIK
jgi:hypothetical protein